MRSTYRAQASKATATTWGVFSPEGARVHTCKSKSDAYRVASKFDIADRVRHTVAPITRYNAREEF